MRLTSAVERLVARERDPDEIRPIHPLEGDELIARIDHRAGHRDAERPGLGLCRPDHGSRGGQREPSSLRRGRPALRIHVIQREVAHDSNVAG